MKISKVSMVTKKNPGEEYVLVAAGFDNSGDFYESWEHVNLQSSVSKFNPRFGSDRLYSPRHNSTREELDAEFRMVNEGF
ncbi:MAG: hypothetical protein WCP89_02630 [archaeon]